MNSKSKKPLKKLLYNDKALMVLCLLLAVLVWVSTSLSSDISDERNIMISQNIHINDAVADETGMKYYPMYDSLDFTVTVEGPKYSISQIKPSDFEISYDTTNVNKTGEYDIPIKVVFKNSSNAKNTGYKITNYSPSSIEAYYDFNVEKIKPIELDYQNSLRLADGYFFGDPIISEDKVLISGPKGEVDKISRVFVQLYSEDEITTPYKNDVDINIDGASKSYLKITTRNNRNEPFEKVSVSIPVYKAVNIPMSVSFENEPSSLPADSVSVDYSIKNIEAGIVDGADVENADIGMINYNMLDLGENKFDFNITKLDGITIFDKNIEKVTATVNVKKSVFRKYAVNITEDNVSVKNIADGKKVDKIVLDKSFVSVISPKDTTVTADDIQIQCDLSKENKKGFYKAQVIIKSHQDSWAYGEYYVNVKLK